MSGNRKSARQWTRDAEASQMLAGPDHRAFLEQVKNQLLIVLLKRLGGSVDLPVAEVDDTGGWNMALSVNGNVIHLETQRKQ